MKAIIKNIIFMVLILTAIYYCLRYPADIGQAVSVSTDRCINVIIPSMFIFMCLTSVTVSSGLHNLISIPLTPISKFIFRLKLNEFGIFFLSHLSGYPTGIKLLTDSYRNNEISKSEFDRLSCICFAGGPAFISGIVSGILYPKTSAGILCFLSVTVGNIVAAIISSLFYRLPKKPSCRPKIDVTAQCLIKSTLSSAHAVFQMCVMITAFGGIYRIAELSGIIDKFSTFISNIFNVSTSYITAVISGIFEISNLVNLPQNNITLLPAIAAMLSFGGICVLVQIIVISDGLLNTKKFLLTRILSATISAIFCKLALPLFDLGAADVFKPVITYSKSGPLPAVMLLLMTLMLLSLFKGYRQSNKKML